MCFASDAVGTLSSEFFAEVGGLLIPLKQDNNMPYGAIKTSEAQNSKHSNIFLLILFRLSFTVFEL